MKPSNTEEIEAFFSGRKLYGDDWSQKEIEQWFQQEEEAYAQLGSRELSSYSYHYHRLNHILGFRHLNKVSQFGHVLGFGSAWGYEFEPLAQRIQKLTIVEPSATMRSEIIGTVKPDYISPRMDGRLEFPDMSFHLVCCLGVLHHIPNVSFVLTELIRVMKPGGTLLLREPIISMGDWTRPRPGLTRHERGIPVSHFDRIFREQPVEVIARNYCFTMTYLFQKLLKGILKKPLYSYGGYVRFDWLLSTLLKGNVRYHAQKKRHRIAPSNIFYVVRKL